MAAVDRLQQSLERAPATTARAPESPAGRRSLTSEESRRIRDRVFGPPGGAGPVEHERELESRPPSRAGNYLSQLLRGGVDVATTVIPRGTMPGVPSFGELRRDLDLPPAGEMIARGSGGLVADRPPQGFGEHAARMAGAAGVAAAPIGGGASLVSRSVQTGGNLLQRFLRGARNLVASGGEAFRRSPGRFIAGETARGGTAGAGGEALARLMGDTPGVRLSGELIGGTAPQIIPARLAVKGALWARRKIIEPFTGEAPRRRAAEAAQGVMTEGDRGRVRESLDAPTTLDPETGEPVLTAPQRAEAPGQLALEKSILESSQQLAREADDQIAHANQVIQAAAREIGTGGTAEDVAASIQEAQQTLRFYQDTRLQIARQRTAERIDELGQGASREQANRIAREELEAAAEASRKQEEQLFAAVDDSVRGPTRAAQEAFSEWQARLGRDQLEDIPARARARLDPGTDEAPNAAFFGETATIKDQRALQSKLREQARDARKAGHFTEARIADDVADAITEDLSSVASQSEALQLAVDFSRTYRQNFRRGAVGRTMGFADEGGPAVQPGMTLERTIAGGRAGEREALDEMRKAMDETSKAMTDPELAARTAAGGERFNAASDDFVRQMFLDRAAPEGQLNVNAAQSFLRTHRELLNRMPNVRAEIDEAMRTGELQRIVASRREHTRLNDPRVSRATLFLHEGPVSAFQRIAKESPERAARSVQQLVNRAARDPTGRAKAGLKSAYVDYLLTSARESARDVAGEPFVGGFAVRDLRTSPAISTAERRLLSPDERERLNVITRDLIRVERARQATPIPGGAIEDQPSKMRQRLARILGAGVGRQAGRAAGTGGTVQIPGQVASIFDDMINAGFEDPAGRLLRDAIRDEGLYREFLDADISAAGELPAKAVNRLQAWAAGVMAEHGQKEAPAEPEGPGAAEFRRLTGAQGEPR